MNISETIYDQLTSEFDLALRRAGGLSQETMQLKRSAFQSFKALGFPTVKNEEWRFTNINPLLPQEISGHAAVDDAALAKVLRKVRVPGLNAYLIVMLNGIVQTRYSRLPHEEVVGVEGIGNLLYSPFLMTELDYNNTDINAMKALNLALFTDGLYLTIRQNAHLDKPIHIINIFSANGDTFFHPRNIIIANEDAMAEILSTSVMVDKGKLNVINSVTQVEVKEHAHLTHYELQHNDSGDRLLNQTYVNQHKQSHFAHYALSLPGAALIRNNLEVSLNGEYTETHLNGLYLVGQDQVTDNHTAIRHRFPNCESHELYKGVLTENGRGVFNGKVYVEREAQKTNAFQQNNNLLLSEHARINTKPQLEIFADDVKCSHGCTVGQFDPESLFYLQSRGIGLESARQVMVEAFMFDVVEKITNTALKKHIKHLLNTHFEN